MIQLQVYEPQIPNELKFTLKLSPICFQKKLHMTHYMACNHRPLSQVGSRQKRRCPCQYVQDGMGSIPATPSTKHALCFPPSSMPASIEISIKLIVCLAYNQRSQAQINKTNSLHFTFGPQMWKKARFLLGGWQKLNPSSWVQIGPDTAFTFSQLR